MSALGRLAALFGGGESQKSSRKARKVRRYRMVSSGAGFDAAQVSDLYSGLSTAPVPINQEIHNSLRTLRARARQLAKNDPYIRRYQHLCKSNVVGPNGFTLSSRAVRKNGQPHLTARKAIQAAWLDFSRPGVCCARNRLSMIDMDNLAVDQLTRDGEILMVDYTGEGEGKYGIKFDFVDPELLDVTQIDRWRNGNEIRMGIEFDARKRVVAYHLKSMDATSRWYYTHGGQGGLRVPAERVIHCFVVEYVDQLRGFPHSVAAILTLRMVNGYQEAELVAARSGANKVGFIIPGENNEGFEGDNTISAGGAIGDEIEDDDDELIEEEIVFEGDPGTINYLAPGAKLDKFDPNHPNSSYQAFMKTVLRSAASGLNTNYNAIANDLEGVNFSSLRGGVIEDRQMYTAMQNFLIQHLKDEQYRRWLRSAILMQAIRMPNGSPLPSEQFSNFLPHEFHGRRWQWVDPLKDAQTAKLEVQERFTSRSQIIRDKGRDPDTVFEEIAEENKKLDRMKIQPIVDVASTSPAMTDTDETEGNDDDDANPAVEQDDDET